MVSYSANKLMGRRVIRYIAPIRSSNRRRYRKSRTFGLRVYTPKKMSFGLPKEMNVKLRYADVFYLNSGALVPAINTFRLNSIYDPDQTGVGGTPSGAVQWSNFYTRYKVMGVKVHTHWTANCNQQLIVGMHAYGGDANNYSTPATGTGVQQVLTELPNSAFGVVGPANLATTNATCDLKRYYSMKGILGNDRYRDMDSSGDTGGNPTAVANLDLMITDSLTATTGNVAYCAISITYYVKFYERDMTYTD